MSHAIQVLIADVPEVPDDGGSTSSSNAWLYVAIAVVAVVAVVALVVLIRRRKQR